MKRGDLVGDVGCAAIRKRPIRQNDVSSGEVWRTSIGSRSAGRHRRRVFPVSTNSRSVSSLYRDATHTHRDTWDDGKSVRSCARCKSVEMCASSSSTAARGRASTDSNLARRAVIALAARINRGQKPRAQIHRERLTHACWPPYPSLHSESDFQPFGNPPADSCRSKSALGRAAGSNQCGRW